jgi:hypothetical protein
MRHKNSLVNYFSDFRRDTLAADARGGSASYAALYILSQVRPRMPWAFNVSSRSIKRRPLRAKIETAFIPTGFQTNHAKVPLTAFLG